jgi:hypothetical protein
MRQISFLRKKKIDIIQNCDQFFFSGAFHTIYDVCFQFFRLMSLGSTDL